MHIAMKQHCVGGSCVGGSLRTRCGALKYHHSRIDVEQLGQYWASLSFSLSHSVLFTGEDIDCYRKKINIIETTKFCGIGSNYKDKSNVENEKKQLKNKAPFLCYLENVSLINGHFKISNLISCVLWYISFISISEKRNKKE